MKKFFIFVAIAMAFIILTSGLAIGRKAADKDEEETTAVTSAVTTETTVAVPAHQDSVFYIDGVAESLTDEHFDRRCGYFTLNDNTYFGFLCNGNSIGAGTVAFNGASMNYGPNQCHFWVTEDMKTFIKSDDDDLPMRSAVAPNFETLGYFIVVFLELPTSEVADPEVLCDQFESSEYQWGLNYDPGEIEGPSAEETTAATTEATPPQVDPWIPEGPGAE